MSESKIGTQLGKTKKFSNYRCVRCHSYLVPCTQEKMELFNFTPQQKQKSREHKLTHFCPVCMRGYQREETPLSEESVNCPFCGDELAFLRYEGMLTNVFWCVNCKRGFKAEQEELEKIEKYSEKMAKNEQVSSKQIKEAMQNIETKE